MTSEVRFTFISKNLIDIVSGKLFFNDWDIAGNTGLQGSRL